MKLYRTYRKRNSKLAALGLANSYQEYLQSSHWKALRAKVLERDNHECTACGKPATVVHHTKYTVANLTATEPYPSLISLCHSCHRFIEFFQDGRKVLKQNEINGRLKYLRRVHNRTVNSGGDQFNNRISSIHRRVCLKQRCKCGCQSANVYQREFKDGSRHTELRCAGCKRFVKWGEP